MGSLATHLSTSLFFIPIGIRRLLCTFSLYLKDQSHYHSKPWFFTDPKWKNLDLYALLIALPISFFFDLLLFSSFSGHPSYRFSFLQFGFVIFLFWVLLILIFSKENFDGFVVDESFLFVYCGVSFLVEFMMNGNGFSGVSSNGYHLLGELSFICGCSCLYLSVKPTAFFADFLLSSGMIFKGTWVLQIGLNLYTDLFGLKGCQRLSILQRQDEADVKCDLIEDSVRGMALMNLLFVGHAIVVLVFTFGLFGLLYCNQSLRVGGDAGGPLLARIESESMLTQSLPEVEME